jgi:hypothetical protein
MRTLDIMAMSPLCSSGFTKREWGLEKFFLDLNACEKTNP